MSDQPRTNTTYVVGDDGKEIVPKIVPATSAPPRPKPVPTPAEEEKED